MTAEQYSELKKTVESLHAKLDTYHKQTIENTTDISWLKRGMFGTFFTYIGAFVYTKFGG